MTFLRVIWDEENDLGGNVQHIAEHDLATDDVEYVLSNAKEESVSHSSGNPCVFGYTAGGDYIIVIYERIEEDTVYPITAYDVPEPR